MDPLIYAERLLWIRDKRGNRRPLFPNAIQRSLRHRKLEALAAGKKPRFLILKYRQGGITTWEQAESFWLTATRPYHHAVTLGHTSDASERIFQMVQMFYESLPTEFQPHRRAVNKRLLYYDRLGSQFYVGTAGALAFGRGTTLQRVHGSEVAFWEGDVANLVAGLLEAAAEGEATFETTPNGLAGWFPETWKEATEGGNDWTPLFFPWFEDPMLQLGFDSPDLRKHVEATLTDEEKALVAQHHLTLEQLNWRRDKKRALKSLFIQEYPEDDVSCFIASGNHFFDLGIIRSLVPLCQKPVQVKLDGHLTVWKHPVAGRRYVIGADASEGVAGGDYSFGGVLDFETFEQVAAFHDRVRPEAFGSILAEMGLHYNKAMIGVEANNHGHSVLNTLQNTKHYSNLYYHHDYVTGETKKLGWQTNEKTRPILLDGLQSATEQGLMKVNDKEFLGECLTFDDDGTGKYQAREGYHDDRIIGWGIAAQLRKAKPTIVVVGDSTPSAQRIFPATEKRIF